MCDEEITEAKYNPEAAPAIGQPRRDRGLDPACDAGFEPHGQDSGQANPRDVSRAQYAIKWKKAYYGLPDLGWIIEIVAYDVCVNVVFLGGADFDSPPPLGDTGRSRYVKLKTLDETKAPEIRQWIEQAGSVPGWK